MACRDGHGGAGGLCVARRLPCPAAGKTLGHHRYLEILEAYGRALGKLNLGKWQHGCLYLKHVFVDFRAPGVAVALLDLEKARKRFSAKQAARHDLRQVKRRSGWDGEEWGRSAGATGIRSAQKPMYCFDSPLCSMTCPPIQHGWKASSDFPGCIVRSAFNNPPRCVVANPTDRDSHDLGGRMEVARKISQQALDNALVAFARYKIGEIKIFDLEQAMSFEAGEALSESGLVQFTIAKMASGRYRISDEGENAITQAGRDRLEAIRGRS
ncbi:lipopolysaccharide kinase InaA family protein [Pseudomonas juntendi]|nr:lipopolysaccharide kinase InaA family protein [Pseudomonas juntendi]